MIDRETIEKSLDVIKFKLQGGFVKLQHELELTITPYIKNYILENHCNFRNTTFKYKDIVNNSD